MRTRTRGKKTPPTHAVPPTESGGLPWLWSLVVLATHLLAYCGTLFPSIPGGDATELIFNGCQLSVPHPPGYPLFTLIEWAFIEGLGRLGGYPPAYCANLAAAVLSAFAAWLLFLTVAEITDGNVAAATVASVLFGSGKLVWFYSIQAEVFSLNNLLVCAIFFLTARYARRVGSGDLLAYCGAFVCGLALTNQHTAVFYVVPCALYVYWAGRRRLLDWRRTTILILAFGAGLSPYAYLFLAPGLGRPGSWGDTSNLGGFLTHLLRREYGTFRLFSGTEAEGNNLLVGLGRYVESSFGEDCGAGLILAALGAASCLLSRDFGRGRGAIACVLACFCFYTVTFHYLANLPLSSKLHLGVHARFWMQSHAALYVVAGAGLARVMELLGGGARAIKSGAEGGLVPLCVLLIALMFGSRYKAMDESENRVLHRAFSEILTKFPEK